MVWMVGHSFNERSFPLIFMEFKRKIDQMLAYFKSHPSSLVRASMGFTLVIAGVLGPFLPILGIWMVPMGLVLLAVDFPVAHRLSTYLSRRWDSLKNLWQGNK